MFKPIVCLMLAYTSPLLANTAELAGVWKGNLGSSSITACFNGPTGEHGSYYYQRTLTPIWLIQTNKNTSWTEEGNTGFWTLTTPQDDALSGAWRKTEGGKPLPITLHRVGLPTDNCGSDVYNAPMEAEPLPVKIEKKTFDDHSYALKIQGAQVTLKLEGDSSAIQKINRQLAALAVNDNDQVDYFRERREDLGQNGSTHTTEIIVEPTYWSSQWITIKFYRWFAGTGRNGISWGLHSWNLQTGESVDPWTWFGGHQEWYYAYSGEVTLPVKFSTWLAKHTTADEGCPVITSYSKFDLEFNTHGLHLSTPAYGDGCENDLNFTWEQLEPVLTAQGKAALPSLKLP